ncbi:hypothetical protein EUGRSUZ_E02860 [Eucalyptus grandis]|uniref:Uncharacterized protein n=2 Tax=Eucalyptus grandis TaxID=71139 RepID=A0A059C7N5_EUCGR|nr:hypothetical protein EUGRSUZ_E02860 [Eucalyptus grandis]
MLKLEGLTPYLTLSCTSSNMKTWKSMTRLIDWVFLTHRLLTKTTIIIFHAWTALTHSCHYPLMKIFLLGICSISPHY